MAEPPRAPDPARQLRGRASRRSASARVVRVAPMRCLERRSRRTVEALDATTLRWSPVSSPAVNSLGRLLVAEAPDRNLALELVRVTEAAALACARWVGFGDKIAADQAAVDAMRHMLATVEMDGVVVIGEGEKDEAPMLFNGERIGTHHGRGRRRRRRPAGGHRPGRARPAERARGRGRGRVGHDVRPRAVRLHGEARLRRRHRGAARPRRADRGDARDDRPGQARPRARPDGGHPRPAPARGDGRADPRRPARASASSRTATWPAR